MEPLSEKRYLELHAPAGGDFLAARERLLAALPDGCRLTLGCLQQLYPVLSAADYRVTVTLCPGPGGTDAVRVEPGDTTAEHYGLCLDIGSTIMQMELVDLVRGRTLSQAACTNSQTQFGANILDRILAVKADRENLKTLQALTLSDVRGMIDTCCRAADIRPEAISAMTVGGNTTMLHFFLGCDPWLVFQSPYTPVFFDPGVIRAAEPFGENAAAALRTLGPDFVRVSEKRGAAEVKAVARFGPDAVTKLERVPAKTFLRDMRHLKAIATESIYASIRLGLRAAEILFSVLAGLISLVGFLSSVISSLKISWKRDVRRS